MLNWCSASNEGVTVKHFTRTENGATQHMSSAEALREINHAMMGGKRDVRTMSSGSDRHSIEYKDGRKVEFVRVDGDVPAPKVANVVSVNGGEVHAQSAFTTPGKVRAACRPSARTRYVETSRDITCAACIHER